MAGLLDWITDGGLSSSVFGGGLGAQIPGPADSPMQPMQQTGMDQAAPPSAAAMPPPPFDPSTSPNPAAGFGGAASPPQPVPLPQPRPDGAPGPMPGASPGMPPGAIPPPPPPTTTPGPAGPPTSLAPPAPGPSSPAGGPAQTWLGRALGITPDQAGMQGQQIGSGLAAGLKSVGDNWNKPGLAAFAGSAGSAMEGAQKESQIQEKAKAEYLAAAIKARQAGDEQGYKNNRLMFDIATQKEKLAIEREKMASKDAGANKNDSPTQLYLSAQRLVQPDRKDMNTQLSQMRKDGADPAEIAKKQAELETAINAKLADHFATLGLHPQTAAQIAQQPGMKLENPIDAGTLGITKDNIGQKLQPGQYYKNPSDGKVYQYKGKPGAKKEAVKGVPDKPTTPEPDTTDSRTTREKLQDDED